MKLETFLNNAGTLLENNMAFYSKKADSCRKLRAKSTKRFFKGISRNQQGQAVLEFAVPSASNPGRRYQCYISVEPPQETLFVLAHADGNTAEKMAMIKNADVKCFCTCPDFNWSGMKYNMKHRYDGYEEGHTSMSGVPDGSDIRPKVRDPRGKNTVCKHLLACFNGILLSAPTIMKAARNAKFPKEYTAPDETPEILGKEAPETQTGGEIQAMNGSKKSRGAERTSGKIQMANSKPKAPVMDYPSEEDAITMLGESAPVKIPEAQDALDALAGTLGPSEESGNAQVASGEVSVMNSGESGDEHDSDTGGIQMFNGSDTEFNALSDIEDAAQMPMFNPDDDEDDELK